MGIWFALHGERVGDFNLSLGASDGGSTRASSADILPVGSFCKPWTAVAIMRMAEQGTFQLDDPFPPLVDPYMERWNKTSTVKLWGAEINNVTIRMLLHMNAGIVSYNDTVIHKLTVRTMLVYIALWCPLALQKDITAGGSLLEDQQSQAVISLPSLQEVHCWRTSKAKQ